MAGPAPVAVTPQRRFTGTADSEPRRAFLLPLLVMAACEPTGDPETPETEPEVEAALPERAGGPFEVWIVDQADSDHREGFGGWMYIFDGADLMGDDPGRAEVAERMDLAQATSDALSGGDRGQSGATGSSWWTPGPLRCRS